jgi:hypothetical protein
MSTQVSDIANQALDSFGHPMDRRIGDLQDGSAESKVILRHYGPALRQISRAANWNCLRKRAQLVLLNDATGQTTNWQISQGINPPTVGAGTIGMRPWLYEYALPTDCCKARFVPVSYQPTGPGAPPGNIALPNAPLMSGLQENTQFARQVPARFVVSNDAVPTLVGAVTSWAQIPDTAQTLGQGLTSQTVILTNQRFANLVYTALVTYPDQWDPLFRQAFVALLASLVVMGLTTDRKLATALRSEQIQVCKMALEQARISDGNEGNFSSDIRPDWLRIRNSGPWSGGGSLGYDGVGVLGYGYDACAFGDGSSY